MFEWRRSRKIYNDGVYTPQRLRHVHDVTTSLHSERGS